MDPNRLTEAQRRALGDCLRALLAEVEHQRQQKKRSVEPHPDDTRPTKIRKLLRSTPASDENTRDKRGKKSGDGCGE